MTFGTDKFFDFLYQWEMDGKETLLNCPADVLTQHKEKQRERVRSLLGLPKLAEIAAGHCASLEKIAEEKKDGYTIEAYHGEILPNLVIPFYMVKPDVPNGKAMLYCHGHGSRGCLAALENPSQDVCLPIKFARRGFTAFVPEMAGIGQVVKEQFPSNDPSTCYPNAVLLAMYGLTLTGVRVWEAQIMTGWIQKEFGFDNIGIYGISGGGQCALFTAAVDDRFRAVVVAAYGNLFHDSIMAMRHCVDNYLPGTLEIGECPEIMGLIAPKPLLLTNGDSDPIFPLSGTEEAIREVSAAYQRLGSAEKFESEIFHGGHEFSLARVFDFIQKYV